VGKIIYRKKEKGFLHDTTRRFLERQPGRGIVRDDTEEDRMTWAVKRSGLVQTSNHGRKK